MNAVRISTLNGINALIGSLKDYAGGLPFAGRKETSLAGREKKAVTDTKYTGKWPGGNRGWGPVTKLCEWEKSGNQQAKPPSAKTEAVARARRHGPEDQPLRR